jgi:type VI secretion system secreted protein Hcp
MKRFGRWMLLATLLAPVTVVAPAGADTPPPAGQKAPAPTVPAHAAYLQMRGVTGGVTEPAHAGWIAISSFQWGVGRGITSPAGGSSDREGSTPSISNIVITKTTDSASPNLFRAAATGQHFPQAVIELLTRDGSKKYVVTLSEVFVTSAKASSGSDRPTESLTLNFSKITFQYTPTSSPAGSPTLVSSYDVVKGEAF